MRLRSAILCLFAAALPLLAACSSYGKPDQASSQLAFGVDMAKRGLWKEAFFRFQEAERLDPQNPRIQSNLGVAAEAAGHFDQALSYYQTALRLAPNDKGIRTNYTRFVEFYQGFKGQKEKDKKSLTMPVSKPAAGGKPGAAPPRPAPPPPAAPVPKPSTPEDTPPPPADNRPPR